MCTLINPNYFSFCFIGYKAQIETLLSYGTAAKETHLKSSLYFKDEAGCEDENKTASSSETSGYLMRKALVTESKKFNVVSQLHLDFLNCPKLLPPGCNLKLYLTRQNDEFSIMAEKGKYKINIIDLQLSYRKIKISSVTASIHNNKFKNGGIAIYPFHQV